MTDPSAPPLGTSPVIAGDWRATADYHTHTRFSRSTHASGTVEDNVAWARNRGLARIAITDHGPAGLWYGLENRARFFELLNEVCHVREKYPDMDVLVGMEANLVSMDGDIDAHPDMIAELDILLLGFHPQVRTRSLGDFVRLVGRNSLSRSVPPLRSLMPGLRRDNTRALVRAVDRHPVSILTHPGLRIDIDTAELARVCTANNTLLEINSAHRNTTTAFIDIARGYGARFVLSSDAHSPERVGQLGWAMHLAQSAGLSPAEVANVEQVGVPVDEALHDRRVPVPSPTS